MMGYLVSDHEVANEMRDLRAENERLKARLAIVEPVYRAACAWRNFEGTVVAGSLVNPQVTLIAAIDKALAQEGT